MNFFDFARSRIIAWWVANVVVALFGLAWLLWVIPLFTGPSGAGDHNGIGILIGFAIAFFIWVKTVMKVSAWLATRYEAQERAQRDRIRAENDVWRRTHPL